MSTAAITRYNPLGKILSASNFDICGFTGVIFVVLNTNFKLVSFYINICNSSLQVKTLLNRQAARKTAETGDTAGHR
jgi:hypothetical protein